MEYTQKPSCRIFCKTDPSFTLAIKNDKLVLTPLNPKDESQFWVKEFTNTPMLDADGVPSFALVNKFSNQAIKRAAQDQPLSVAPYDSNVVDISLFWSEGPDKNDGYAAIRPIGGIDLCFDAQKANSSVVDGTCIVLWTRNQQNNQWWKIENNPIPSPRTHRITCKANTNLSLAIRSGKVVLANQNANDAFQHWYRVDGEPSALNKLTQYVLVNKATGQVIQRPAQFEKLPVRLFPNYHSGLLTDATTLWCEAKEQVNSYRAIRADNHHWYPNGGQVADGRELQTSGNWNSSDNMRFKTTPY